MKKITLVLLAAALLLSGCTAAAPAAEPTETVHVPELNVPAETKGVPQLPPPETEAPAKTKPQPSETPTETEIDWEHWEEDFPQEYPVEQYRLEDGALKQTGEVNRYRYTKLENAEDIIRVLSDYIGGEITLDQSIKFVGGYGNWFYRDEERNASVSASSVTGRFSFYHQPGAARAKALTDAVPDGAACKKAAEDFVRKFGFVTGDLELAVEKDEEQYNFDPEHPQKNIVVPSKLYYFTSDAYSRTELAMQDGLSCPVLCGNSEIPDPNVQYFSVTVWPDGTVVAADNYITRAGTEPDGTDRMPTEAEMPKLLSFFTSTTENDTMVIRSIRADCFDVYFGRAEIEPTVTVEYYFESKPEEILTTEIVLSGLFT